MGNPARKTYRAKRNSRRAQTFKASLPGIVECPLTEFARTVDSIKVKK